jgi:DNA-binding MarR family transcriptional regulator
MPRETRGFRYKNKPEKQYDFYGECEGKEMSTPKIYDFGLWLLFSRTHNLLHKARTKEFEKYGIWGRCAAVVEFTSRWGNQATQATLVNETFFERHTISEQLTRMENNGFIKRVRDLNRKNAVRIEMTDKGRQLLQGARNHDSIISAFETLTEEEKQELWRILSKMRAKLIEDLNWKNAILFPPSNPDELA